MEKDQLEQMLQKMLKLCPLFLIGLNNLANFWKEEMWNGHWNWEYISRWENDTRWKKIYKYDLCVLVLL